MVLMLMGLISGLVNLPIPGYLFLPLTFVVVAPFCRFFLLLPATAVGQRMNLNQAWDLGENNGWRLFLITYGLPLIFHSLVTPLRLEEAPFLIELVFSIRVVSTFDSRNHSTIACVPVFNFSREYS